MPTLHGPRSLRLVAFLTVALLVPGCTSLVAGRPVPQVGGSSSVATTGSPPTARSVPTTAVPPSVSATAPHGGGPLSSVATPTTAPPTTAPPAAAPKADQGQHDHDAAFSALLGELSSALRSGEEEKFLSPFAPALLGRVKHWFHNTRSLGVAATMFAPEGDYSSAATDAAGSFSRTVVLGVRTPYDDSDSMPGVAYSAVVSVTTRAGRQVYTITSWQPKYVGDPMNCNCTLSVVNTAATAVVTDAANRDLTFWAKSALGAAVDGIGWADARLPGSDLIAPKGQVIFLADQPFHWFLSAAGPGQSSNVTAALVDASGEYPGTRYSHQSRIVLMLRAADGSIVPNDEQGREYAEDVLTHESTHQLMNRNSMLAARSPNSPPSWVVEGIAVAVETLHRDSLGAAGRIGYPEPNDPKNTDGAWYASHLTDTMPTQSQLYASDDGAGYYAISGSVFRYLEQEYGYVAMMRVAKAMYAKPAQNPFDYFPDPDRPGSDLQAATAWTHWKTWFVDAYE